MKDDLIAIITQKIKQNPVNREKIDALIKTYGTVTLTGLSPDKYEALMTDLAQICGGNGQNAERRGWHVGLPTTAMVTNLVSGRESKHYTRANTVCSSASKMWLNYPPSVLLQEQFPSKSTTYALKGKQIAECEYVPWAEWTCPQIFP